MKLKTLLLLAVALTGCVPADPNDPISSPPPRRQKISKPVAVAPAPPAVELSATDPCAERLHALCGPLLLYYRVHKKLPAKIEELKDIAGPDPDVEFSCPVSGKPYVYFPDGLARGDRPGFIVISDSEPTHSGLRWAVVVEKPRNTVDPLITRVIAEPETAFQVKPVGKQSAVGLFAEHFTERGEDKRHVSS